MGRNELAKTQAVALSLLDAIIRHATVRFDPEDLCVVRIVVTYPTGRRDCVSSSAVI